MDALLLAPKHHGRLQPVLGCRRPSQQSYAPFKPAFLWAWLSESNPNAERSQYQTTCRWSRSPAAKQSRLAEDMVSFTVQWICLVLHDLASRVYQPNSCMFWKQAPQWPWQKLWSSTATCSEVAKFAHSLPQENTCECLGFPNSTRLLIELWCWCCYSNSATDLHFDTATAVTATKFTDQQQPIHEKRRAAPRARLSRFDPHPVSSARSIISDFPFFNMLQSIFVQQLCKCPPSSLSEQPPSTLSMPWWELTSINV